MMRKKPLLDFLIAANLLGALYGFVFYYGRRLLVSSPSFWAFIPDCPLYALLFAVALIMIRRKKKAEWFYFISFVGAAKYGFWTVYVLGRYSWFYFTPDAWVMYSILFVSHVVLLLEPLLLLGKIRPKLGFLGLGLLWFFVNDLADYWMGLHPPIPVSYLNEIFAATVAMTLVSCFGSYALMVRFRKSGLLRF